MKKERDNYKKASLIRKEVERGTNSEYGILQFTFGSPCHV